MTAWWFLFVTISAAAYALAIYLVGRRGSRASDCKDERKGG